MALIEAESITKVYRVARRKPGFKGGLSSFLFRTYDEIRAVDQISFKIEPGELVGYIGPNGAGKSTTIKMLTGILIPTAGNLMVNGFVPSRDRKKYTQNIGVVFGQRTQLWWDIPVIESFKLLRKVYRIPDKDFEHRFGEFRKMLELDPFLDTPVRKLSLGQRMRCDLVASMLHGPRIIFLDEPTIGLDVIAKLHIRGFLERINREFGVTMILTTHDLQEIEELCQRLIIIDHGKILYDGNLPGLRKRFDFERYVTFQYSDHSSVESVKKAFASSSENRWEQLDPLRVKVFVDNGQTPADVIANVLRLASVHDITIEEPSIDSIVGHIYNKGIS